MESRLAHDPSWPHGKGFLEFGEEACPLCHIGHGLLCPGSYVKDKLPLYLIHCYLGLCDLLQYELEFAVG